MMILEPSNPAVQPPQQQQPQFATPHSAVRPQPHGPPGPYSMRAQQPAARLPTQPIARSATASPQPNAAATSLYNNSMEEQMTPDTAKIKCKNFLATMLWLARDQPESVARNVRGLIQGLIDGRVEPELFTTKILKELNASPQLSLAPFLKKSIPYLQQSLAMRELTIEGVNPPNASQVLIPMSALKT